MKRLLFLALLSSAVLRAQSPAFDTIIRHGTVIDGSGNPRFDADIGISNGFIVGDRRSRLGDGRRRDRGARGCSWRPASSTFTATRRPTRCATAVNMLTQGVTTEIFNADGNGPLDVAQQMKRARRRRAWR